MKVGERRSGIAPKRWERMDSEGASEESEDAERRQGAWRDSLWGNTGEKNSRKKEEQVTEQRGKKKQKKTERSPLLREEVKKG